MEKEHRLAVGAELRLAVAEYARALPSEAVARRDDVVDLVADVVDAALGVALQELGDRGILAEGLEQLDLGIRQRDEDRGDAVRRLRLGSPDGRARPVPIAP